MTEKHSKPPADMRTEVIQLNDTLKKAHAAFRREHQTQRQISMAFLKGTVSALGAIAAVAIVLPIALWILQAVEWPPLIADLVGEVILLLEQSNRR